MNRLNIYYCKTCGNVTLAFGKPSVQCCGETLVPLSIQPTTEPPTVTELDGEILLEYDCPMTKEDYIAAVIEERYDRASLIRLFAEQAPQVRISQIKGARIIALHRQQDHVWAEEYKG